MFSGVNRNILKIAVPAIVANITAPLMAMVDMAIVGHLGDAAFIAAIAVGGSLFNLLYWGFAFLRMGTSGMTAQAFGAGNGKLQWLLLSRAMTVGFAMGLLMLILQRPLISMMIAFMDVDGSTASLVDEYCTVCICGAPAMLMTYALTGWFIGRQDSRSPMWISIFTNMVNIAMSLLLVYVFKLSIKGVAAGTMIAQWSGFFLALAFVAKGNGSMNLPHIREVVALKGLARFFRVNSDIFLRTLCLIAVTLWFTRAGASQGTVMLSVNALLMQFFIIFSYFIDGFAYAGEALAGRFLGAGDSGALRHAVKALFKWGAGIAVIFTMAYLLFGHNLIRLLSDDPQVLEAAEPYTLWIAAIPAAGVAAFVWDGIFIGLTKTRAMLLSMGVAMIVFFAILHFASENLGNNALWTAFVAYLLSRGAIQTLMYIKMH